MGNFLVTVGESSTAEWSPLDILNSIYELRLENSVTNAVVLLRIFLTVGVGVASSERNSKLRFIKTHLRSSMGNLRLTNVAVLSIEHEMTER